MPRLSSPPDSRLRGGRVVSTSRGLCVVLKRVKERVALVPIIPSPECGHRADVHPSWIDTYTLNLKSHDVIRCSPFVLSHHVLEVTKNIVPNATMVRILQTTRQEMHTQAIENGQYDKKWRV